MSPLQQIRWNSEWVAENIGKQSGLEPFAYTPESIHYLEQFLVDREALVTASGLSVNKYVHLLGAYLGECILANYGGQWQESPEGTICIQTATKAHELQPFHQIYLRITNGRADNLRVYFSEFIPQMLASE